MSELSDKIQAVVDGISGLGQKVVTLGTDLTAEIAALEAKIASGGVTPDDLAKLGSLATSVTDLGTTIQGLDDQAKAAAAQ